MYSNLVAGVDGHHGGRDAAALGSLIAEDQARLTLANVWFDDPLRSRGSNPAFELAAAQEARELVRRERELSGRPLNTASVGATSVGAGLERVADERGADLIVVGSCHRGVVGRVLLGDDAASVLHHAHRSVAIAPTGYRAGNPRLESVGVAYDGSAESEVALAFAQSLATARGAEVVARCVVTPHVMNTPGPGGGYMEDPRDLIAHARAELRQREKPKLEIVVGSPGSDLLALSESVDLLVCGSRHNSLLRRIVLGSTSANLAHHARCPVIVTPSPAEQDRPAHGASAAAPSGAR